MIIGTFFYSFFLGVVILIYIKIDRNEMALNNRIKLISYFRDKYGLPNEVSKKMKMYF